MAKFKLKISSNAKKKELSNILYELKKYSQNEIPFNFIIKVAEALGFEYQVKNNRAKGSLERFTHPELQSNRMYNGYVGVHIIHKGGNKMLVQKRNFNKYLFPAFILVLKNMSN